MPIVPVDAPDDPRIGEYGGIPDPDLLARHRLFVAEGRLVVRRLLASSRFGTRSVLVTPTAAAAIEDVLATREEVPVYLVTQELMNRVAGFHIHRGCLALGVRPMGQRWQDVAGGTRRLVVLERVGDADNVGSVFRHAAAFGAGGVLLGPACADPLYRKAIRTSMGWALAVPFAEARPWPQVLGELAGLGWSVTALTPAASAQPLRDRARDVAGGRAALVLGHEGEGLSPKALAACTHRARIPMQPGVDSLNVAAAAAVALYELAIAEEKE